MDVHDVPDGFSEMMENQRQALQKAQKFRGQRPRDPKSKEEMSLIFSMMNMQNQRNYNQHQNGQAMVRTSLVPPAYLPCTTPLDALKRIAIRDLQLETHHRGTYLLLRAMMPPIRMTGVIILAEDDYGGAVMLQLYQQEEENTRKATDIVNEGAVVIVKEPYFKSMANGGYGLRVDHLSDLMYVDRDDPKIPQAWRPQSAGVERSAEALKIKGNSFVNAGKYWQAITEYSEALSHATTTNETEVIKRNRSLAYLKTKQYDAALIDTGFPDFGPSPSEKALFRAAEALYYLGRFSESRKVLELLLTNFENNKQALAVLDRVKIRCTEQDTGEYNFAQLQIEAKKLLPPQLDHATYIGPVEVRATKNKGRGLFVTRAVKAGDLLLCEKAFSHAYATENAEGNSTITILMNFETNRGFKGGQADLITIIAQKLYRNPSLAPAFNRLYHGTYEAVGSSEVDGQPIVDTFLIERVMSLNVFGCPRSTLATRETLSKKDRDTAYNSCGIWIQASRINHSCTSTARRSFIGDMMIVRATQDLEPDTEVTFWYQTPEGTSPKQMREKLKNWGFVCDCEICQDPKGTEPAVLAHRKKLLERMKQACKTLASNGNQTDKVERLLEPLNDTYTRPPYEVPRLVLSDPLFLLSRVYFKRNNLAKSMEYFEKLLTALGFLVVGADSSTEAFRVIKWGLMLDHLKDAFLHARDVFAAMKAWEDSKQAEEYAKTVYRTLVGEDATFDSTMGKNAR